MHPRLASLWKDQNTLSQYPGALTAFGRARPMMPRHHAAVGDAVAIGFGVRPTGILLALPVRASRAGQGEVHARGRRAERIDRIQRTMASRNGEDGCADGDDGLHLLSFR